MWIHINPRKDYFVQEQWIRRRNGLTVCSLRCDLDGWTANLLNYGGISSTPMHLNIKLTLDEAQAACDMELNRMGHSDE